MPRELEDVAECPEELEYIWEIFKELDRKRTNNGFSKEPLTNAEIVSWERRRKIQLSAFEHELIDLIDALFMCDPKALEEEATEDD